MADIGTVAALTGRLSLVMVKDPAIAELRGDVCRVNLFREHARATFL